MRVRTLPCDQFSAPLARNSLGDLIATAILLWRPYCDISPAYHNGSESNTPVASPSRTRLMPLGRFRRRVSATGEGSMAARAYETLKAQILEARYIPGQFLQEVTICQDLGLGRTPVRQALQRLDREGLIEVIHRKGLVVRADSLDDVILALDVRILVEPFCAAHCALKATQADLAQFDELHAEFQRAKLNDNRKQLMIADTALHMLISDRGGNALLQNLLNPIHERMSRLWHLPQWSFADFSVTSGEHDTILEALHSRDFEAAWSAMETHLISLKSRFLSTGAEDVGSEGRDMSRISTRDQPAVVASKGTRSS